MEFGKITLQRRYDPPDWAVEPSYWSFFPDWEGVFVLGGSKRSSGERYLLDICLEVVGVGVGRLLCRGWLGKSTPGTP